MCFLITIRLLFLSFDKCVNFCLLSHIGKLYLADLKRVKSDLGVKILFVIFCAPAYHIRKKISLVL